MQKVFFKSPTIISAQKHKSMKLVLDQKKTKRQQHYSDTIDAEHERSVHPEIVRNNKRIGQSCVGNKYRP